MSHPTRVVASLALVALALAAVPARADDGAAPKNRDLEAAKKLVDQGRGEAALRELDIAARLPGNTDQTVTAIAAVRAEALSLAKHPDEVAVKGLVLQVLHQDPDGKLFEGAPPAARTLVDTLIAEHPLVLHEAVKKSEPGRPVRLRAKVRDPKGVVKSLTLHMKGHSSGGWTTDTMKEEAGTWTGYIRDPSTLAPPGVTDGFEVDYYVSAEDASGEVVDSYGAEDAPVELEISSAVVSNDHVDLAALELTDKPPAPMVQPVAPAAVKPWWQRWYTLAGAGAVVVAGTVTAIVVASQPPKLDPHVGVLTVP